MKRNRAWRLHQKARYRKYTRHILKEVHGHSVDIDERVIAYEKNRKPCSCFMCGNPRRGNSKNNKTMQERRHEEDRRYTDAD